MPALTGPEVWRAADIGASGTWRVELPKAAAGELVSAAKTALHNGTSSQQVGRASFPLNGAAALFESIHQEVEFGRGFAVG